MSAAPSRASSACHASPWRGKSKSRRPVRLRRLFSFAFLDDPRMASIGNRARSRAKRQLVQSAFPAKAQPRPLPVARLSFFVAKEPLRSVTRLLRRTLNLSVPSLNVARLWFFALVVGYGFALYTSFNGWSTVESGAVVLPGEDPTDMYSDVWEGRHFLFCISPGRAGSRYINIVLGSARDLVAFHEPAPRMNDAVLRDVLLKGHRDQTFEERRVIKMNAIGDVLLDTSWATAYAETSHMFVKTFSDVVLTSIAPRVRNVTVLVLHRDLDKVIWSQLRLGWFSANHSGINSWYYDPRNLHESERVLLPHVLRLGGADGQANISPDCNGPVDGKDFECEEIRLVDSLFLYNLDIAARAAAFEEFLDVQHQIGELRNVVVRHVKLHQLSDKGPNEAAKFLSGLGLVPDEDRLTALHLQGNNARDEKKDRFGVRLSFDTVRNRVTALKSGLSPELRKFLQ